MIFLSQCWNLYSRYQYYRLEQYVLFWRNKKINIFSFEMEELEEKYFYIFSSLNFSLITCFLIINTSATKQYLSSPIPNSTIIFNLTCQLSEFEIQICKEQKSIIDIERNIKFFSSISG